MKEVCTDDRMFGIGENESPTKFTPETKVEGEQAGAICCYWSTINCLKTEVLVTKTSAGEGSMTITADLVSMRQHKLECLSIMQNRRLENANDTHRHQCVACHSDMQQGAYSS